MTRERELMKEGEAKWLLVAALNQRKKMVGVIERVLNSTREALRIDAELEPAPKVEHLHD